MFRFIGLAEEAGSGIPRMKLAWRSLGFESPTFDPGTNRYEFSVELRSESLLAEDDLAWLEYLDPDFGEAQRLALVTARHEGSVDNARLRELTNLHPADVTQVLGNLRDIGLLQMLGAKRGARYELDPSVPSTTPFPSSTAFIDQSTAHLEPSTASFPSKARLIEAEAQATAQWPPGFTQDEWERLEQIAKPIAESGYIEGSKRNEIILALCQQQALSLLELTWLMRRAKPYVRRLLKEMIDAGQLQYSYPDRPQHPNQRYRTHLR
jgi:predicted HTH transcriptional regulator